MKEEKQLMTDLLNVIRTINSSAPEIDTIKGIMSNIDDAFMLLVVGEFNSGKSSLINALLGGDFLKSGPLPTTEKVCVLRYMNKGENVLLKDFDEIILPVKWLEHVAIIDTPGTNAIIAEHEKLAHAVVPRADLIIFVTSAERPISESEASFLKKISAWGRNVIMVVNKLDILEPHEREKVLQFVSQNTSIILGTSIPVPVFGISARYGLQNKINVSRVNEGHEIDTMSKSNMSWDNGNITAFENYLHQILSKHEIITKKLLSPLRASNAIVTSMLEIVKSNHMVIDSDEKILTFIDNSMKEFLNDITRDIKYVSQNIDMIFNNLIISANNFFDNYITLSNIRMIFNTSELNNIFMKEVLTDINIPINTILKDVSNLIANRAQTQSEAIIAFIGTRSKKHANEMIGSVKSYDFEKVRQEYVDDLHASALDILRVHNAIDESKKLEVSVNACMQQFIAIEALTASSMAGLVAANSVDVTGMLALSSIAMSGLFLIPYRRSMLKYVQILYYFATFITSYSLSYFLYLFSLSCRKEFALHVEKVKTRVNSTISVTLDRQLHSIREKIVNSYSPYDHFVRVEKAKAVDQMEKLEVILATSNKIRKDIQS
jgi:small GTP-binding protein